MYLDWLGLDLPDAVAEVAIATKERDAACLEAKKAQERADVLASELAKARELILQLQSQGAQIQPS